MTQIRPNVSILMMIITVLRCFADRNKRITVHKIIQMTSLDNADAIPQLNLLCEWRWIEVYESKQKIHTYIPTDAHGCPKVCVFVRLTKNQNKILEIKQWINQVVQVL